MVLCSRSLEARTEQDHATKLAHAAACSNISGKYTGHTGKRTLRAFSLPLSLHLGYILLFPPAVQRLRLSQSHPVQMMSSSDDEESEPGVPGKQTDEDGRPYFGPSNRPTPADAREQREGFVSRWQYRGHTDAIRSACVIGEDSIGKMRVASTDGRGVHSWWEFSPGGCIKSCTSSGADNITSMVVVESLDVLAAASVRTSVCSYHNNNNNNSALLDTSRPWNTRVELAQFHSMLAAPSVKTCAVAIIIVYTRYVRSMHIIRYRHRSICEVVCINDTLGFVMDGGYRQGVFPFSRARVFANKRNLSIRIQKFTRETYYISKSTSPA